MSDVGDRERHEAVFGSWPLYFFRASPIALNREAGERDREEWIDGVKQRLGLVCTGDDAPSAVRWEVISEHTLELPPGLPPGCRCVISDGEWVSLGGPCPVHSKPAG